MYHKSEVTTTDGSKIAVLDVDIDEFMSICNSIKEVKDLVTGNQTTKDTISLMVKEGVIPLISSGSTTKHIFNRYMLDDYSYMTVVLTGIEELMNMMGRSFDEIQKS